LTTAGASYEPKQTMKADKDETYIKPLLIKKDEYLER